MQITLSRRLIPWKGKSPALWFPPSTPMKKRRTTGKVSPLIQILHMLGSPAKFDRAHFGGYDVLQDLSIDALYKIDEDHDETTDTLNKIDEDHDETTLM